MIKEVRIGNFKSVQDLTLSLGRFNVLIGSNGSGKSNILEAIAFGAAASADKLDNEFLGSRGIRSSTPRLMKSAFNPNAFSKPITLEFKENGASFTFNIDEEETPVPKWSVREKKDLERLMSDVINSLLFNKDYKKFETVSGGAVGVVGNEIWEKFSPIRNVISEEVDKDAAKEFISTLLGPTALAELYKDRFQNELLSNFIIYSPEIGSLRKLEGESQIVPLGIKGEGLFNLLQIFKKNENYGANTIAELKKYLHAIEWFDDFDATIDEETHFRQLLSIKDRFISDLPLNQNNVNEGFLFLLFYVSLILSKETPSFFAIDNVEASFHPALCKEFTKNLVELCKKHNKQVILTTHNPFVLDGLDLNDDNQRLFVIRRNALGETVADQIEKPSKKLKLSEAWMRGYIGGQPETIE